MPKQKGRVVLLVIDPQVDFCDPAVGKLYVAGAENDTARLSTMIKRLASRIDDINCTLDSHHIVDIAHPIMWVDDKNQHPSPFTIITHDDVLNYVWRPMVPSFRQQMLDYTKALQDSGRYPLCVWPEHCLIGTPGQNVMPELLDAFMEWERERFAIVNYVTKGSNWKVEHYSGVKAEVADPEDVTTQLNVDLIGLLMDPEIVYIPIAGQALSHCVANTIRDIADNFGPDAEQYIKKFVLLTDATSPVTGFEGLGEAFVNEMTARGMQTSTTVDFLS